MQGLSRHCAGIQGSNSPCRILLVDDDLNIQATLMVLLKANFHVSTALTVAEGFPYLKTFAPDLVICALSPPYLEGVYFLQTLRARLPTCPVIVLTTAEQAPVLQEVATLGIDGFHQKPVRIEKLLAQIKALLAPSGQPLACPLQFNRYVSEAITYICCNYAHHATVRAMADAIGVSPSHLAHLFRRATGMTVRQYLTAVRLEVAKRLLTSTNNTLDSIAEHVGFCNASHLSRVFRDQVGCWPGSYRRYPKEPSGTAVPAVR